MNKRPALFVTTAIPLVAALATIYCAFRTQGSTLAPPFPNPNFTLTATPGANPGQVHLTLRNVSNSQIVACTHLQAHETLWLTWPTDGPEPKPLRGIMWPCSPSAKSIEPGRIAEGTFDVNELFTEESQTPGRYLCRIQYSDLVVNDWAMTEHWHTPHSKAGTVDSNPFWVTVTPTGAYIGPIER